MSAEPGARLPVRASWHAILVACARLPRACWPPVTARMGGGAISCWPGLPLPALSLQHKVCTLVGIYAEPCG